ncbi:MAG TPA: malto-oligosyltrehalose synthase [Acidimicrobiales bacterium]|jgi:(1->4)-alpha-D-glucan 1-alpha-D-glucosylmutase|nr:malto-oligosyltrehalose synthase [Acidimicrobiales bacterium]
MRRATYRLQLQAGFGFDEAAAVVDYLVDLGISDLYVSPILQAASGSTHGYDVVDHSRLSEDLGGDEAFGRLHRELMRRSMGLTVDIVPNHMAIDGPNNRWWWDVLENGPSSLYATYFDIDWPGEDGRHEPTVLVPVLGDRYGRVLDEHEVRVVRTGSSFTLRYFDHELPVSPRTLDTILGGAAKAQGDDDLLALADEFAHLPHASLSEPSAVRMRHDHKERLAERLAVLLSDRPELGKAVDAEIESLNIDAEDMDALLRRQNYRLAYWRTARDELDYRRFFNIETLVGVRVEDDQVFSDTHATIGRLVRDGAVDGLRVDHIDGLHDPDGYLQRLNRLAPDAHVFVEKILESDEHLPTSWPVSGTTGYDFLAQVTDAFVDRAGEGPLTTCYTQLTGEPGRYEDVVLEAKFQVMRDELAPEVERLAKLLHSVCENHRGQRDRTRAEVATALQAVLAAFPVYRTYARPERLLDPTDARHVDQAVRAAKEIAPGVDQDLIGFVGELLRLEHPGGPEARFAQMFPQLSAPVMAKGAEDTAFYRYNRLISLNEVGGDPGRFGRPLDDFHRASLATASTWPETMLTLATHDTKRSPYVRARISLLSELPEYWEEAVTQWFGMTDHHAGDRGPDYNARYLLFQTLVGTWPIATDRLVAYMDKAAKEAKVHTSWSDGDAEYDEALRNFVTSTVSDDRFVLALEEFLQRQRISPLGRAAAVAQHAVLLTCPGIPDIYQGTETWDNSLVDPDNRRPVDFRALASALGEVSGWPDDILAREYDRSAEHRAKLWLTNRLLTHRRERPECYDNRSYEPLTVRGEKADHLIAFTRPDLVVLVGRHLWGLGGDWGGTTIELPPGRWRSVVGPAGEEHGGQHRVGGFLGHGPVAVLERVGHHH